MKLRYQIACLMWVPLVLYIVSIGFFLFISDKMYAAAERETTAKKIIALCQETFGYCGKGLFAVSAPAVFQSDDMDEKTAVVIESINHKTDELRRLTKGNFVASKLADRVSVDAKKFMEKGNELVNSLNRADGEFYFSQYIEMGEFWESLVLSLTSLLKDLNELMDLYGPTVQEFEPRNIQARKSLNNTVVLAVIAIGISIVGLGLWINKTVLAKLQIVMTNMRTFSRGKQDYKELSGTDELAELDRAFKEMRDERNKLDELRKSMQAMISHDIRAPLSSINLTLEVVLDANTKSLDPDVERRLRRTYSEVQRLSRLVTTLLDVEKIESGELRVDMRVRTYDEVAVPAITAVSSLLERRQLKLKEDADEDVLLKCDVDRTIQVLVNFLSNAVKFAPPESTITVTCKEQQGRVRFEVTDEGPGVPADKVDSLFQKFSQLDQPSEVKQQGTGLGLFICKMLINAQGGSVGYRSPGERGACFWFELPGEDDTADT